MANLNVLSLFRRRASAAEALFSPAAPTVRCRHCDGSRLKLSYRRRDRAASAPDDTSGMTFILRCGECEGFTTVRA